MEYLLSVFYFMFDLIVDLNSPTWHLQAEGEDMGMCLRSCNYLFFVQERCKTSLNLIMLSIDTKGLRQLISARLFKTHIKV